MIERATPVVDGQFVTWDEYEHLPEDPCVEYVDARLVVDPRPSGLHQQISLELAVALRAVLPPTHKVNQAWGWKPGRDEFIPDVMVYSRAAAAAGTVARFTGTPDLVVEILSSNRRDDLVWKAGKYAAAGLPRYWVVDPRDEIISTYALHEGVLRPEQVLGRGETGELDLGVARVRLCVDDLLA